MYHERKHCYKIEFNEKMQKRFTTEELTFICQNTSIIKLANFIEPVALPVLTEGASERMLVEDTIAYMARNRGSKK
ncbi:hypothetical protein [Culicoidibacter larvae]|uniref:hypothetical protein n=1 Tax=Culicoidibacter larvae TaxID=2579976 RepID=UPI0014857AAC|nr:hypothetical protein [Culicoidibacter larvae]